MSDKKVDVLLGNFKLPAGYGPTSFVALGKMDGSAGISAGPTVAKTVANQVRRTIQVHMSPTPGVSEFPPGVLGAALDEAKKMSRATVTEVKDRTVQGCTAKQARLHHKQGAMSVVSFVVVIGAKEAIWTVIHSCLDDPKALEATRKDFEDFIGSIDFTAAAQ